MIWWALPLGTADRNCSDILCTNYIYMYVCSDVYKIFINIKGLFQFDYIIQVRWISNDIFYVLKINLNLYKYIIIYISFIKLII